MTFQLYSNLDDSNSIANLLSDYYRSLSDYDPFSDYAIFRTSQNDYWLCYGDLQLGDFKSIHYSNNSQIGQYSLSFGSGTNFTIQDNGYHFIGSLPGSAHSSILDSYKSSSFIVIGISVIVCLFLFHIFRKHKPDFSRGSITVR